MYEHNFVDITQQTTCIPSRYLWRWTKQKVYKITFFIKKDFCYKFSSFRDIGGSVNCMKLTKRKTNYYEKILDVIYSVYGIIMARIGD